MKTILSWLLVALLAASASLYAGAAKSSAQGYVFMPPAGWKAQNRPGRGFQIWVRPDNESFHQNISILAEPYHGDLSDFVNVGIEQIKRRLPDVQIGRVQQTTVCYGHPAAYLTYTAAVNDHQVMYEQMATIWNTVAYIATYARLSTQPSLDSARHALVTMCGGSGSAQGFGGGYVRPRPVYARPSPTASAAAPYVPPPSPVGSVAPTVTPRGP